MADNNFEQPIVRPFVPGDQGIVATPLPQFEDTRLSVSNAINRNPDYEAELLRLSQKTGVPMDSVRTHPETVKQRDRFDALDLDKLEAQYPSTYKFLANQQNADVSHDDTGVLGRVEQVFDSFKRGIEKGSIQDELGALNYKALTGTISTVEQARREKLKGDLGYVDRQQGETNDAIDFFTKKFPFQTGYTGRQIVSSVREGLEGAAAGASAGAIMATIAGQLGPQVALPEEIVTVPGAAALGGRAGFISSSVLYNYKMESGFAFDEFSDLRDEANQPLSRDVVQGAAIAVGLVNAGLETVGELAMLKLFPGADKLLAAGPKEMVKTMLAKPTVRQALANAGKRWVQAASVEGFTEAIQELSVIFGRELAQGVSGQQFKPDDAGEDAMRVLEAGGDAFTGAMGVGIPGAGYRGYRGVREAQQMQQNQEFITALGEDAKESKLQTRLPEKFREFVARVKENGPIDNIYIPAEQFQTFFQSQGVDPAEVASQVGATNYSEALAAGTDVVIPIENYASTLAATPMHEQLAQDIRLRQSDMTAREYAQFQAEREQAEADLLRQAQEAAGEIQTPALQTIKNDMVGQLVGSGYEQSTADAYATLYANTMRVMAERSGQDLQALHERYGLSVSRPLPDILTQNLQSDISIDPMIDMLRSGVGIPTQTEMRGESLLPFIKKIGGIKPGYGELKDADVGAKRKDDFIVREDGLALDEIGALAAEAGYFDPDETGTVSETTLLNAIAEELSGIPTYSIQNENQSAVQLSAALEQLNEYLDSLGIDLKAITDNAAVRQMIEQAMSDPQVQERVQQFFQQVAEATMPETINVDGVERPTRNSEGRLIYWSEEGIRNFWRWFGDSKVVDAEGRPQVVYHGTQADFDTFQKDAVGSNFGLDDEGFFFTDNTIQASGYADPQSQFLAAGMADNRNLEPKQGANVLPVYLSLQNPLTAEDYTDAFYTTPQIEITDQDISLIDYFDDNRKSIIGFAKDGSNDGILFQHNGKTLAVAFEPEQIKSATGNNGQFDSNNPSILFQTEQPVFDQTQTDAFKRWSNNAPFVSSEQAETYDFKTGEKIAVESYHGTGRPDRVGTVFQKKRATSGPMAFFTSSPELASSYAQGKQDTSLAYEDGNYANWFKYKPKGARSAVDIVRAWYSLDAETKAKIRETAPKLRLSEDLDSVIVEEGNTSGNGSYDYNYEVSKRRGGMMGGNPLEALVEDWLSSGNLFDNEELFMDVLRKAGFPAKDVQYDSPNASYPFVYKTFIEMQKPLVTTDIPQEVIDALQEAAKRDRSRAAKGGADMWDKNTRTLKEWVAEFTQEGDNAYVWTSIPDKVTDVFKSMGYDGIVDWSGKGGGSLAAPVYIPFEETQVKSAIGNKGQFDATKKDILRQGDKQGYIQFGADRKFNIALLEKADLSTFLHETGHFWLEVMGDLASDPQANDQIKGDYATLLNWFGVESREQIGVEQHEMFARANEAYLMEGKAPSAELRSIFQRFKSWLTMIYRQLQNLNVELTPEVRGVFDRIYATDQEIEDAKRDVDMQPLLLDAASAGMSEQEFALYRQAVGEATASAKDALTAKLMREFQREQKTWWKEALTKMREEVAAEVDARPVYRAFAALTAGKIDDMPIKLNKAALVEKYGAEYVKRLPRSFARIYTTQGGMDADAAATYLGFESGDALVESLVSMRPRNELIAAEADVRMRETYGDMMTDGTLADEARIALHNEQRERVLMTELRALRRKQAEVQPFVSFEREKAAGQRKAARAATQVPPVQVFRDAARGLIGQTAVRNIQPYRYLQAERRAARAAFEAMAKGDYMLAADAKQKELLNHYLYLEASKAKEDADATLKYVRKFESGTTREQIGKAGADYLDQIDALLDRYEFRRVPLRSLDRRASLALWAAEQEAQGNEVAVDPVLLDEARRVNYREVPIDELRAVRDAVKNIEHLARLKNKLITKGQQAEFKDAVAELVASAENNGGARKAVPLDMSAMTMGERAGETVSRLDAMLLKMEQIVEWLDDGNVQGPWHTYLWNPIAEAQSAENDLTASLTAKLAESLEAMPKQQRESMLDTFEIPGMGKVTRKFIISIGMNMGNAQNIDKMMRGFNWDMGTIEGALAKLNAADIKFIQDTLDTIGSLWPQIAELEKRMTGLEPPRVETAPFDVRDEQGNVIGKIEGYFPLVYDPRKSEQGAKQETGNLGQLFEEGYVRATTPKGHTKARTEGFAAPLMLDFEQVVTQHMAKVVKDLTHREAIVAANKILTNPDIRNVLQEVLGTPYEKQMLPWLRSVVNDRNGGSTQGLSDFSRWMMTARANVVAATMGFKATTAIMQIVGLSQSIDKVQGKYLGQALLEFLRHPVALTRQVRELSGEMRHRSNMLDRDIRDQLRNLTGQNSTWAQAQKFAFHGIAIADAMVSVPTWMGAYKQALDAGLSEEAARLEGDAAVRLTQGSGGQKDLSAIQRNNELAKTLTMFYSYFNVLYNRMRDTGRDVQEIRDMPRFLSRVFFTVMVPAVLAELIVGRGPGDDEDPALWTIRKVLLYPLMSVPLLRDIASMMDSGFDYKFSPIASGFDKLAKLTTSTGKMIEGDMEWQDYAFKVADTIGYVFGVAGTAQMTATGKYLWRVEEGDESPDNLAELIFYATFGKRKE